MHRQENLRKRRVRMTQGGTFQKCMMDGHPNRNTLERQRSGHPGREHPRDYYAPMENQMTGTQMTSAWMGTTSSNSPRQPRTTNDQGQNRSTRDGRQTPSRDRRGGQTRSPRLRNGRGREDEHSAGYTLPYQTPPFQPIATSTGRNNATAATWNGQPEEYGQFQGLNRQPERENVTHHAQREGFERQPGGEEERSTGSTLPYQTPSPRQAGTDPRRRDSTQGGGRSRTPTVTPWNERPRDHGQPREWREQHEPTGLQTRREGFEYQRQAWEGPRNHDLHEQRRAESVEPRNGNQDQTIAQVDGQRNVAAWKRFETLVPRLD